MRYLLIFISLCRHIVLKTLLYISEYVAAVMMSIQIVEKIVNIIRTEKSVLFQRYKRFAERVDFFFIFHYKLDAHPTI